MNRLSLFGLTLALASPLAAQWTEGGARIGENLDTLAVTLQGFGTVFSLEDYFGPYLGLRDTSGYEMGMWANYGPDGSRLYMGGATPIVFRTYTSSFDKVAIPQDAIQSFEISDEPGVASATNTGSMGSISSGMNVLLQRTIVVPASGYLLVVATAQIGVSHTNGTSTGAEFGVSLNDSTTLPANQDVALYVGSTSPTMSFGQPVTVQGLFEVGPGTHTLYFLANKYSSGGGFSAFDGQLSVIYIPTAYGTVTPTKVEPGKTAENPLQASGTPAVRTPRGMEERMQSEQANQARIQAELQKIRQRLADLEAELRTQKTR